MSKDITLKYHHKLESHMGKDLLIKKNLKIVNPIYDDYVSS